MNPAEKAGAGLSGRPFFGTFRGIRGKPARFFRSLLEAAISRCSSELAAPGDFEFLAIVGRRCRMSDLVHRSLPRSLPLFEAGATIGGMMMPCSPATCVASLSALSCVMRL
jgi:hypothetical protein